SGHEFVMDDKSKEGEIYLKSEGIHKLLLSDLNKKIEVTTKDKHKVTMDDKNEHVMIKSKSGHTLMMDDKNERMELKSKNGHYVIINDKSGEEKIQLSDKPGNNTFIIDITNQKLVIETKDGSLDILAKNEIKMKSKKITIESESETINKTKDFSIKADNDFEL